ncbi:unnamed protein product [Rotaria socialis]|nr:unnamed protein product [Rotaria socialis]
MFNAALPESTDNESEAVEVHRVATNMLRPLADMFQAAKISLANIDKYLDSEYRQIAPQPALQNGSAEATSNIFDSINQSLYSTTNLPLLSFNNNSNNMGRDVLVSTARDDLLQIAGEGLYNEDVNLCVNNNNLGHPETSLHDLLTQMEAPATSNVQQHPAEDLLDSVLTQMGGANSFDDSNNSPPPATTLSQLLNQNLGDMGDFVVEDS